MKLNIILSAILLASLQQTQASTISSQMDEAFNTMTNITYPSSYMGAKRGSFTGGQIFIRNQQKNVKPFNVSLPRATGGCGGIDAYLGGFSFISADAFIQAFQNIGSNALGYGVKLALQSNCDACENIMTSLEKTAQFINGLNMDSCTVGQGIVAAGEALIKNSQIDVYSKSLLKRIGIVDDFNLAQSFENDTGKAPAKEIVDAGKSEEIQGNVTWKAIKNSQFASAFGGDTSFLEMILSMVGTSIYSVGADGAVKDQVLQGGKLSLKDLVKGSASTEVKMYKCDTTEATGCLNPTLTQDFDDIGIQARVLEAYTATDGYIKTQIAREEWSFRAKKILSLPSMTALICNEKIYALVNTDVNNESTAVNIAQICSERIALEMSKALIDSYFKEVETTLLNADKEKANVSGESRKSALKMFKQARKTYEEEYDTLNTSMPMSAIFDVLKVLTLKNGKVGNFKTQ